MFDNDEFKFYLISYWTISPICDINGAFGTKKYSIDEINNILEDLKIYSK
jgi:hypothetical protein